MVNQKTVVLIAIRHYAPSAPPNEYEGLETWADGPGFYISRLWR